MGEYLLYFIACISQIEGDRGARLCLPLYLHRISLSHIRFVCHNRRLYHNTRKGVVIALVSFTVNDCVTDRCPDASSPTTPNVCVPGVIPVRENWKLASAFARVLDTTCAFLSKRTVLSG